jgi:hypothetical protein
MPISISLENVEPWKGGTVLSPGSHPVRCTDAEEGRSAGGHFELHLTWEATAGPEKGGTIQDWVQVTQTTLGKVRQLMEACALSVPAGEFELGAGKLQGAQCVVVVRERPTNKGTMRNEIVAYQRVTPSSDLGDNQGREFVGAGAGNASQNNDPPPF